MKKIKLKSNFEYTLANGKALRLRWIRPEDKERIADGVKMMSNEGLYLRFFMPIKELSDAQLNYFTNADQVNHIAWGVLDENCPTIPGLGIARFVRDQCEPHIAEAAVTVPDDYQSLGIGTLLFSVLHLSARVNNITILRAFVLAENRNLLRILNKFGGVSSPHEDNIVKVDLPIYKTKKDIPDQGIDSAYRNLLIELESLIYLNEA